jgi:peptidoglycan/xylan/chitin deacetylase (PgdA/CDA1 family)
MHAIKSLGLALAGLTYALAPAIAEEACAPRVPSANALGVSRTVEVDTTKGPRFGFQYKDQSFLEEGEVVLTFDDGPLPAYTVPVLDALAAHCAKATFFMVGRMAAAHPEMVKEIARRGHTIGTHTWSHARLPSLSAERARAEIELGFSAVQKALGQPPAPFFRFPFLRHSPDTLTHLEGRHIGIFSIDVDSKDFRTRDPGTVHHKVFAELARARKGIILFHDIQVSTARALPAVLATLKDKGYRIVHMQAKAPATTVAEFDSQADQELDKRRVATSSQPLAKRALTWPVSGSAPKELAADKQPETVRPVRRAPRPLPPKPKDDWPSKVWLW